MVKARNKSADIASLAFFVSFGMMQPLGLGYFFPHTIVYGNGTTSKQTTTSWEVIIRVCTVFPQIMAAVFIVEGTTKCPRVTKFLFIVSNIFS